jgi:hypothetical protein
MIETSRQEKLWFLDTLVTIRVSERDSDDGVSVIEHEVPFGSSPPLHVHQNEDEVFHVLSGDARFSQGARWLTVTRNGDFERMVRATARPAEADALPPAVPPTPEQAAALEAACRAHGIALVGPPLAA